MRIVAVVIEHADGSCALVRRSSGASWASTGDAKKAVEEMTRRVIWSETTPGVWCARSKSE